MEISRPAAHTMRVRKFVGINYACHHDYENFFFKKKLLGQFTQGTRTTQSSRKPRRTMGALVACN